MVRAALLVGLLVARGCTDTFSSDDPSDASVPGDAGAQAEDVVLVSDLPAASPTLELDCDGPEVCTDGIDNDCNMQTDGDDEACAIAITEVSPLSVDCDGGAQTITVTGVHLPTADYRLVPTELCSDLEGEALRSCATDEGAEPVEFELSAFAGDTTTVTFEVDPVGGGAACRTGLYDVVAFSESSLGAEYNAAAISTRAFIVTGTPSVEVPNTLSYEGLQTMYENAHCSLPDYSHWSCQAYFDYLDDFLAAKLDPEECRTNTWQTDPMGLGTAQLALPAGDRSIVFIDPCNTACSDTSSRAAATNPATPLCSLVGMRTWDNTNPYIRPNDTVYLRRGIHTYFNYYETTRLTNRWVPINRPNLTASGAVNGANDPDNVTFAAYPGDEGLVTTVFATVYVSQSGGVWSTAGPGGVIQFSAFNGLRFEHLRFVGSYDYRAADSADPRCPAHPSCPGYGSSVPVPAYLPDGRYYSTNTLSLVGVDDLVLDHTEILWNEGYDEVIDTRCDPADTSMPCYNSLTSGGSKSGQTLYLQNIAGMQFLDSKLVGTRYFPRDRQLTASEYPWGGRYSCDGMKPGGTMTDLEIRRSYLGECSHFTVELGQIVGGPVTIDSTVIQNRIHTGLGLGHDYVFSNNLLYNIARNGSVNRASIIQAGGTNAELSNNRFYVASPNVLGISFGQYGNVDNLEVRDNVMFGETGLDYLGFHLGGTGPVLGATSTMRANISANLVFGFKGLEDYGSGILAYWNSSLSAAYSPAPGQMQFYALPGVPSMDNPGTTVWGSQVDPQNLIDNFIASGYVYENNDFYIAAERARFLALVGANFGSTCTGFSTEEDLAQFTNMVNNRFRSHTELEDPFVFYDSRIEADWDLLLQNIDPPAVPYVPLDTVYDCRPPF